MAKKIYISPSSQTENRYAYGGTNEAAQCRKIATATVEALKRCGFEAMTNITTDMYGHVKESNAWNADLHIPIHTNAHNGKTAGTRLFYYDTKSEGYKVCKAIMATLSPITPGTSDNITPYPGLYEVKNAKAPVSYIEVAFHDNVEEAKWIIEHIENIAEAICKGICNHYGVKYIEKEAPKKNVIEIEVPDGADKEAAVKVLTEFVSVWSKLV